MCQLKTFNVACKCVYYRWGKILKRIEAHRDLWGTSSSFAKGSYQCFQYWPVSNNIELWLGRGHCRRTEIPTGHTELEYIY